MPFDELHHVTFQQDITGQRKAWVRRGFLGQEGLSVLNWLLPSLPVVSPVENLWDVLGGRVCPQAPVLLSYQLQVALPKWDNIGQAPPASASAMLFRIVNLN